MDQIEFIARLRHLAWCAYQLGAGQPFNISPNQDQLDSLKQGVKFALENPNMTSKENHNNWMKMKASQGWVYGSIKNFKNKTHPDMVPYEDLPEVERAKDDMDRFIQKESEKLWNEIKANIVFRNVPF